MAPYPAPRRRADAGSPGYDRSMLTTLLLLACTPDVTHVYEAERSAALSVASEVPANWKPDAALAVATPDLARAMRAVVTRAVAGARPIELPLALGMTATLNPNFEVTSLQVAGSTDCAACFAVRIALAGNARWEAGPAGGTIPVRASASAVLAVSVTDGRVVEARPKRVEGLTVEVPSLGNLRVNASGPVQEWLRRLLVDRLAPVRVATLDTGALPIRTLRLSTSAERLVIELLTDVPGSAALRALPAPTTGVELAVAQSTVTGLARRAAFEAGTLDLDVAVDPRKLTVDGEAFALDLRLWRLVGRGWYRDYAVAGTIGVERSHGRPRLHLEATRADVVASSPGALLVDPLAALFQSRILDAIVDAMDRSLPAATQQKISGVAFDAKATGARGLDDALRVYGTLDVASGE